MIREVNVKMMLGERFTCFGEFDLQDRICRGYCALRIRCAVEKDQNTRLELMEDVISPELMYTITK